jgi:hypothetical protein
MTEGSGTASQKARRSGGRAVDPGRDAATEELTARAPPATLSTRLPARLSGGLHKQRRYALFVTGTRWADERRFGRITEARTNYLPYPFQETVGNPNPPTTP